MSLQEEIEKMKTQLAEGMQEEEVKEEEIPEEEEQPVVEEAPKEETKEEPKEEPKEEKKEMSAEEKREHDRVHANLRRERDAYKRQVEELQAKKEEPKSEVSQEEPEYHPIILDMVQKHQEANAEREFNSIEAQTKINLDNYDAISAEYKLAMAQSIKTLSPRLPDNVVWEKTRIQILEKAAEYVRKGLNPVEELYHEARDLGFKGQSFQKQEVVKEDPKPDMAKVAANRKRSAGMANSSGEDRPALTKEYAATQLTNAEWMKLSADDKRRILSS